MTDVVNKSSADESEEKQRTLVKTVGKHCVHEKFNMKSKEEKIGKKFKLSLFLSQNSSF